MTTRSTLLAIAAALLFGSAAAATPPGAAASAPRMGQGMGDMHGWRMNRDNTPGWSMMSRAERQAHHDKMVTMTDRPSCDAYMEQHRAEMTARAKERGRPAPGQPRHDPCAALKK